LRFILFYENIILISTVKVVNKGIYYGICIIIYVDVVWLPLIISIDWLQSSFWPFVKFEYVILYEYVHSSSIGNYDKSDIIYLYVKLYNIKGLEDVPNGET